MALRLFLMGVVASLALDLPNGGLTKTAKSGRAWLDTRTATAFPDAGKLLVALPTSPGTVDATRPMPRVDGDLARPATVTIEPKATDGAIPPVVPNTTILPVATIELAPVESHTSPILPGRAEAAAILASEFESALAEATTPVPVPMPAPEIVEALPTPAAGAATAPEVPVTLVTTDPMAPPPVEAVAATTAPLVTDVKPTVDPDAVFSQVVSGMASAFASQAAPIPVPETKPLLAKVEVAPPLPLPAEEIVAGADEPAEDLYPGLAYALNRASEGLAPPPFEAPLAKVEAGPLPNAAPALPSETESSRSERLARAVQLTGQAVNAWASLLSQRPAATSIQR
ncbi:MAG: hypothetical protein JWN86_3136 [Planctomycetota bacterium]|nr:hypothetical protein [Planctomycetota bacterium]